MKKVEFSIIILFIFFPLTTRANVTIDDFRPTASVAAKSAIVIDQVTGNVLYEKDADAKWIPASLTKLVTALVVLDSNPKMTKLCTMTTNDEVGGARLYTYAGAKYKLQDLFAASLVASANNATSSLVRCIGLTEQEFVDKMNAKAKQLGALSTHFVEPTGMDIRNITTARDMAKIANAAFSTKKLRDITQKKTVTMSTVGTSPKKTHYLKSTNLLLKDASVKTLAGKTGYLDESLYNFAGSFKSSYDRFVVTVVLGSPAKQQSFSETKELVKLAQDKTLWQTLSTLPSPNRVVTAR